MDDSNYLAEDKALFQGCQIFLGTTYQNGENIPIEPKIYQMTLK
jgi:hypothetical protein